MPLDRRTLLRGGAAAAAMLVPALRVATARAVATPSGPLLEMVGALHEHTGYSDGVDGTIPADVFAAAKRNRLDFIVSTEHSDGYAQPLRFDLQPAVDRWERTREQVVAATDSDFVAVRGFEWTSDRFGHLNVLYSTHFTDAKTDGGYVALETFWSWFSRDPAVLGGGDGLAIFNHPNGKKLHGSDPVVNWNDFAYVASADERMVGIEVFGSQYKREYEANGGWYSRALNRGWHVGAIGAEDTHDLTWGSPDSAKTVILSVDRTPEGLREALLARRFYAVSHRTSALRLDFEVNSQPMGSRLTLPTGGPAQLSVRTRNALPGSRIELCTSDGALGKQVVAASDTGVLAMTVEVPTMEQWWFAQVVGPDPTGEAQGLIPHAYSTPVWLAPTAP